MGAAATILLSLLFTASWLGDGLRHLSFDLPVVLRPTTSITNENFLIIYMDELSAKSLKQDPSKDWDRSVHTRLLKILTEQKAQLVVFDVLFDKPWTSPDVDLAFAKAMTAHGTVAVGAKAEQLKALGKVIGLRPIEPTEVIGGAAAVGMTELPQDTDGVIRMHYYSPKVRPSMALKVAHALGKNPTNDFRPRWINYYGSEATIPSLTYSAALESSLPTNFFTGKKVFVGQARSTDSKGTKYETLKTPRGNITGVEVLATTCLNFLRGDWLTELALPAQYLVLIFSGFVCAYGFVLVRPWTAAGLALLGFFATAVVALVLMWRFRIWFPWLIVAGVQIPGALAWTLFWNTKRLYHEKEVLEEKLATATSTPSTSMPPQTASPSALPSSAGGSSIQADAPTFISPGPAAARPDAGPQIPDHDLVRQVGKGAYGEVWLARDVIGSFHAVKIVYRKTFSNDGPFEREFKGIQKFTPISRSHPGFVHVLHVGRNNPGGYFYYIMEAGDDEVTGQNIDPATYSPKNLAQEIDKRGKFPLEECLRLSLDLTAALEYLHQQNLIHRDIKPSNIIFVKDVPKIADIGLVTEMAEAGRETTYLGTEGYIPPEGPGTAAGDIYSLGKVIYEASMGRNVRHFPGLPATLIERPQHQELLQLNDIVLRACEPNLRIRYKTMAEMRADLLRLQNQITSERAGGVAGPPAS